MTSPLPSDVAAAIGHTTWPDDPALRATLLRGLRGPAKVSLYRWAYTLASAGCGGAPTSTAWAAVLGVSEGTLRSLRSHEAELNALEMGRTYTRRDDITPGAMRARESRDRKARGEARRKPGRRAKTPTTKGV